MHVVLDIVFCIVVCRGSVQTAVALIRSSYYRLVLRSVRLFNADLVCYSLAVASATDHPHHTYARLAFGTWKTRC